METNRGSDKLGRGIMIALWCISHFILVLMAVMFIQEQVAFTDWLLLLALSAFWSALVLWVLSSFPNVLLSPEGIRVRVLLRERFYTWSTIKQAGILWRMGRGMWYNEIVLLKENGSRRRYKDKTFLIRNIGKTIHISYSEEAKAYIISHYGPLDFNLSYGREEKSIVVDEKPSI